jgi:hypothetical protein
MTIVVPYHDESLMPMMWGSPLRCPSEDWLKYRIRWVTPEEYKDLLAMGRGWYKKEWAKGDKGQVEIVAMASRKAFGGNDNNQILRDMTGKIAATYLSTRKPREFLVVDIGAGSGLLFETLYHSLPRDFKGEIRTLLLDPAGDTLETARVRMEKLGVKYEIAEDTQDQLPKYMKGRKAHVLMQTGSIHHDPKIPFDLFYECTADGGILVSGDWHPQNWQEPFYVYKMLEKFDWPKKEQGLENFRKTYGVKETPFPADPEDMEAIFDIWNFWLAYYDGMKEYGDPGRNSVWPFEGHQDYRRYMRDMEALAILLKILN